MMNWVIGLNSLRDTLTLRWGLLIVFIGGSVALGVIGWINARIARIGGDGVYTKIEEIPEAYTALILGAKVFTDGELSYMLEDRVLTGLELYRCGKVKKLLLSGDHGQVEYDEVNAMRRYLLAHGVPAQDIFMDHAGFDTYDSLYRAREVFVAKDVIIVTQRFHIARALYIAKALGVKAVGIIADKRVYWRSSQTKAEIREIFARVKAFCNVEIWRATPRFLGNIIPITGDGRSTVDQIRRNRSKK